MIKRKLAIFGGSPVLKKRISLPGIISTKEKKAVFKVLETGILSQSRRGQYVGSFERGFARYFNRKYAVSTSSGTTALHAAVCALGIGTGDEVLVPALTFVSTASVVLQERAKPVFVDIEPDTFNMDPKDLEKKITKRTKAVIVVHLYGNSANIKEIIKIARKYKLKIIEDCAQAHGALFYDKKVGSFGEIACFSFQQSKNMTCGEGGMLIMDDKNLYQKCASVVDHGLVNGNLQGYDYDSLGYNYHLTELQAAIGIEQLKKLKKMNVLRKNIVSLYKKYLTGTGLTFQKEEKRSYHVYYCLTALIPKKFKDKRDWFVDAVRAENVEILKLYPLSLPQTKLFADKTRSCPVAMDVSGRLFNFSTNPGIKEEYIKKVCDAVKKVLNYLHEKERD